MNKTKKPTPYELIELAAELTGKDKKMFAFLSYSKGKNKTYQFHFFQKGVWHCPIKDEPDLCKIEQYIWIHADHFKSP